MKNIIFDFDGTIANNLAVVVKIISAFAKNYQITQPVTLEIVRSKTLRQLMKDFHISYIRMLVLLSKAKKELSHFEREIQPFDGMPELLEALAQRGFRIYMLSSNNKKNIYPFLKKFHLARYFKRIYTTPFPFGKARKLLFLMLKEKLKREDTIYVGDEVRDIEAAKKRGIVSVAVTWGFDSETLLRKEHPELIIRKPAELLEKLSQ